MAQRSGQGSALDRSFPSLFVMGLALALALGLVCVCGWKIFALESEWQELARERLLLERDRDAFLTYGGELPQMTERHRFLAGEVARLEDRKKHLEESNAGLEAQGEELAGKASRLAGRVAALETQTQENETELGKIRAELGKLKPERETISQEVAALKASEEGLRAEMAKKRQQEATLISKVEVLEANRRHLEELLARMNVDRELYASFEKNINGLVEKFGAILNRAEAATTDYGLKLADMEKVAAGLGNSLAALDVDRQSFASNLDAFKKDRQNFAGLLKQSGNWNQSIQAQIDSLQAGNRKLAAAMDSVRGLDSRLQSSLASETTALRKLAHEDAQVRASLGAAAQALTGNTQELKTQLERSAGAAGQLADLIARQRGQLDEIGEKIMALQTAADKEKQGAQASLEAGATLGQSAQALATQAEIFKSRLELADRHSGELEKLLAAQNGRLKDLAGLARQLGEEISENRRRGSQLETLLGEIRTQIDSPGKAAPSPASDAGAEQ